MAAAAWTFLPLYLVLLGVDALVTGGFYADNGVDQTIYYPKISKRERREMQQEILSVLGLNHRPKPQSHETDTSAPRYMLDLYNNIINHDTGELKNTTKIQHVTDHLLPDDNSVYDADIIMSFVNRGRKKRLKKCRRLHPMKLAPEKLSSTNRPSCKRRNSTNRSNAAGGNVKLRHERDKRFWFDMSQVPLGETLLGAELRIYKEAVQHNRLVKEIEKFTISVYEVIQGADRNLALNLIDEANVTSDYDGWIHMNVSGPIAKWLIFPETNQGLHLEITNIEGKEVHPRELRIVGGRGRHDHQPFMVAFFKASEDNHIRHTRSTQRQRQRTDISYNDADMPWKAYDTFDMERIQRRSCQKWTLFVSFKELGWQDWIIAPDGYSAFYCSGECSFPLNTHMNATNHAIVQTLVHLMNPNHVPKPCCAPTKLSAISVLYFDDNSNVILKKYRNMVVKSCGCH